jgi:cysteine synthase A
VQPDADAAAGPVVDDTGGSTVVSLALVCAIRRHPLRLVTSDAFARDRLAHRRRLDAALTLAPSAAGRMTERPRDMIEAARLIAADTGAF